MVKLFVAILLIFGVIHFSSAFTLPRASRVIGLSTKGASNLTPNYHVRLLKKHLMQAKMASDASESQGKFDPAAWINPNTRGGVIVWCGLLLLIPLGFYNFFVAQGMEDTKVGAYVGAIFVLLSNVAWASTYVFRVANKDMTYAKQLRDYENAVLQKRLDELADEEITALMEEIEQEEDNQPGGKKNETTASPS